MKQPSKEQMEKFNGYSFKIDKGIQYTGMKKSGWGDVFDKMDFGDSFELKFESNEELESERKRIMSVRAESFRIVTRKNKHELTLRTWKVEL